MLPVLLVRKVLLVLSVLSVLLVLLVHKVLLVLSALSVLLARKAPLVLPALVRQYTPVREFKRLIVERLSP